MALKTEDDYQDKIDDLIKEIEKLYDEGTDLGFKLKRSEDRASDTYEWLQKQYNKLGDEYNKNFKQLKDADDEYKELEIKLSKLEKDEDALKKTEGLGSNKREIDKIKSKMKELKVDKEILGKKVQQIGKAQSKLNDKAKEKYGKNLREEQMEQEERALETEKDYQKAYDYAKNIWFDAKEAKETTEAALIKKTKPLEDKIEELEKDYKNEINKIDATVKKYGNQMTDIFNEAKKKGFKLKRSEDMDLETRKQEILASLEERGIFKSQKDYDKRVASVKEEIKELEDDYERYYSKSAIAKRIKIDLESYENRLKSQYEREANSLSGQIAYKKRILENMHNEAKNQGFEVKK